MGIICGLLAAAIWGSWPVVSRLGVQGTLSPYDITALRYAISGVLLLPFLWRRGNRRLVLGQTIILTFGQGVPLVLLAVAGVSLAPAAHAGVIMPSAMLITSALGSRFLLGDRIGMINLLALAAVLAGGLLIGWQGLSHFGDREWLGDLLFAAAGMCWGIYTVATRAWSVDAVQGAALVSVTSLICYEPLYVLFGSPTLFHAPLSELLLQGVFQGLFAGIFALVFYTQSVTILGATRGALFGGLVPIFTMIFGVFILAEVPNRLELTGFAIATIGMICALRTPQTSVPAGKGSESEARAG
jgi:drug/metabolite transporter (DMT)-like permease